MIYREHSRMFRVLPSPVSKLSLFLSLPVGRRSSLLARGGQVVGEEPNHTTARKLGPLQIIQYSLLYSVHRTVPFKRRVLGALSCFLGDVTDVPTIYNPHIIYDLGGRSHKESFILTWEKKTVSQQFQSTEAK
jgi:hypothetical protein